MLLKLRRRRSDEGNALVLVMGSMLILASMALTTLAFTVNSQTFARYSQDFSGAMAAAQSGVDHFLAELNRDPFYGRTVDCANDAWRGPNVGTNSCGWTSSTPVGWESVVPLDTDPMGGYFHYDVNASGKDSSGTVLLTVTGRVNDEFRTIEVTLGKGGSTDYVYYTDYESADPANRYVYDITSTTWRESVSGENSSQRDARLRKRNACGLNGNEAALYWHEKDSTGRTRADYGCQEITFIGGDELDGEVFTNDTIFGTRLGGVSPLFKQQVYTGETRCQSAGTTNTQWQTNCLRSGSYANFNGIRPQYAERKMLDDNSAAFAAYPGCHYSGSTRIKFHSNGTMTVWNNASVRGTDERPFGIAEEGGAVPACGQAASDAQLTAGYTLPVPDGLVIYVGASSATERQCAAGEIGDGLPIGTGDPAVAPTGSGQTLRYDTTMTDPTKFCSRGNLYAEGILKGRVTLASAESIIVTGDLVLAEGMNGPDLLGLVATNSVEVFHPRRVTANSVSSRGACISWDRRGNCTGYATVWSWGAAGSEAPVSGWPTRYAVPGQSVQPSRGLQIAGSIQTLQHSFMVQNYKVGSAQGDLLVQGSIAQRWRGIVGQGSGDTGFMKDYRYDSRLTYTAPPYFPKWATSNWTLRHSGEINTPVDYRGPMS